MNKRASIQTGLLVLLIAFLPTVVQAQGTEKTSFIKIEGEVTKPLTLYTSDIAGMPHDTASLVGKDGKTVQYAGVPIVNILKLAGVTLGRDLRGENLSKYLLVKAADGYEVLFSLAELDSSFTDRTIILADQMQGQPLPPGKGPFRLIVPGERKPARSIYEVTTFIIRFAKD